MKKTFKEYKEELILKYKKNKFYVSIFIKDFFIETWVDIKGLPKNFLEFLKRVINLKSIFWFVFAIIMLTLFQGLSLTLVLGTIILIIILFKRAKSGEYVAREREREKQRALKRLEEDKLKSVPEAKEVSEPESGGSLKQEVKEGV